MLGYAVNVCELTKKYHIEWIVFMRSDGCVYPGNNAVPIFINVLTETSRFDRKFYFSETFLDIKLESIEREVEKKNDWVPTVILERKRKTKTTESQNDSQITENSQIETESLSDLNVQRQYYYCKSDNETLLNASQKIWEFENLKNCFRITHKVLGCVLNVCELTKIPHCLPMDD